MGIFSLFGKKERQPGGNTTPGAPSRKKREAPHGGADAATESSREQQAEGQRQVARATALKIDAIESEMSSEFVRPATARSAAAVTPASGSVASDAALAVPSGATMLGDTSFDAPVNNAVLEDVPLFEEVAILFANRQAEMVATILEDAVEGDDLGTATLSAWAMLFDLYQIKNDQVAFEHLSIAYASRFETSPPAWLPFAG